MKVTEVPPGPPVLSTMVAEIYGPDPARRIALAREVRGIFESTPGVVDTDWLVEDAAPKLEVSIDREKAMRSGVTPEVVVKTLRIALEGMDAGLLRVDAAREAVPIVLKLDRSQRSGLEGLLATTVPSMAGKLVPIRELVTVTEGKRAPFVYHKNLQPVTYVLAEMAGVAEAPVYGILDMKKKIGALRGPDGRPLEIFNTSLPTDSNRYALKWDGEWHITVEVFRDMGIAFAAVLVLIYVLVVGMVPVVRDAPHHHGADPAHAHRHPARARGLRRLLHRDVDDRVHRARGDHRAETRSSSWTSSISSSPRASLSRKPS